MLGSGRWLVMYFVIQATGRRFGDNAENRWYDRLESVILAVVPGKDRESRPRSLLTRVAVIFAILAVFHFLLDFGKTFLSKLVSSILQVYISDRLLLDICLRY